MWQGVVCWWTVVTGWEGHEGARHLHLSLQGVTRVLKEGVLLLQEGVSLLQVGSFALIWPFLLQEKNGLEKWISILLWPALSSLSAYSSGKWVCPEIKIISMETIECCRWVGPAMLIPSLLQWQEGLYYCSHIVSDLNAALYCPLADITTLPWPLDFNYSPGLSIWHWMKI